MTAIAEGAPAPDPALTLAVERTLDAPRSAVWRCWTEPALMKQWFCPKPWRLAEAEVDLRPGGRMDLVMQGPEGQSMPSSGCYLEVVPQSRLVFTDSFTAGYLPSAQPFMTAVVELSDAGAGRTRLVWTARHATPETVRQHLEMGFEAGWNAAVDQLEALAKEVPGRAADGEGLAHKVRPCLFFADQAEAAAGFYVSLLADSRIDALFRPGPAGPALVVEFTLGGTPYMAMNGNPSPSSSYMSSISVLTEDQAETDRLWDALIAGGGEEGLCGWLKDRFGVHWQIVPRALPLLMGGGNADAAGRVSAALMKMKKIEIAALEAAATS